MRWPAIDPITTLPIAGTEQLLDMKMEIDSALDDIKNQLDRAKANAQQGIMAEPDWFARINGAKRILGRKSQRIQMELSKRKEQARRDHKSYQAAFIAVAKRILSADLYTRIETEAREESTT